MVVRMVVGLIALAVMYRALKPAGAVACKVPTSLSAWRHFLGLFLWGPLSLIAKLCMVLWLPFWQVPALALAVWALVLILACLDGDPPMPSRFVGWSGAAALLWPVADAGDLVWLLLLR